MSNTNSQDEVKRKNSESQQKIGISIDYSDLEAVSSHRLTAVRRGLYAKHLKRYREAAGYSHSSLGRALGIPPQSFYKWERGETGLSPVEAQRIGAFLNVDAHLFYDDPFLANVGASPPPDAAHPYTGPDAPPLPAAGASWWRMSGHALALRGVCHGDLVAIAGQRAVEQGSIALLALGQADGTTRYLLRERAGAYFAGAGPGPLPEPIPYDPAAAHIIGIALALYRPLAELAGQGAAGEGAAST